MLPTSISQEVKVSNGKKGFRAYLNNTVVGQRIANGQVYRLANWTLFDWAISFQITIIVLYILSALAVSIVEYLNPWPMLLMALILFIPIFPIFYSNQHEENLKLFGSIQLICGFVELFWSSCVILEMHYHSNDWRVYFTMFTVYWQFMSVILISIKCSLLKKIINGQKKLISFEKSIIAESEPSSCSVDLRPAKLRSILNFEKQRLDERRKRREER
uniref:Uncharacterized protein n=1 Tax=Onchocerca volvulus TaxID=6282 RepID=A0A8R1TSW0_ONCVO